MAERREKNWQKIKSRNETSTFYITGHTQRAYIPGSGAAFLGPRLRREAVISTQFSKQKIRTSTEHTGGWRAIFRNKTSLSMPIICLKTAHWGRLSRTTPRFPRHPEMRAFVSCKGQTFKYLKRKKLPHSSLSAFSDPVVSFSPVSLERKPMASCTP